MYIVLILTLLTLLLSASTSASQFNFTDYCGVLPYPLHVQDFPILGAKNRALGAKLMDSYFILRHGQRTPLRTNCFANVPGLGNQEWGVDDCPYNTVGTHSGLMGRNNLVNPTTTTSTAAATTPTVNNNLYPAPIHPLPDRQELRGVCHLGQLTQAGLMGAYNQGFRVGSYLNKTYDRGNFDINGMKQQSTDSHRTRETAQAFLTGLFDWMPAGMLKDDNQGLFSPVKMDPLTWVDTEHDLFKISTNVCNTDPYTDEAYNSPVWKKYQQEVYDPLLSDLRTRLDQTDLDLKDIYDCAKSHFCADNFGGFVQPHYGEDNIKAHYARSTKTVPDYLKRGTPEMNRLEDTQNLYWYWPMFEYDHIRGPKLYAGGHTYALSLLWKASAVKNPTTKPNIYTVVGHDHGPMMTLVSALQLTPFRWPPYAGLLAFEFFAIPNAAIADQPDAKYRPTAGYTTYMRFVWANEAVVPKFCTTKALNNELCPADVVLSYLLTILPTHEECPGIRGIEHVSLFTETTRIQMEYDTDWLFMNQHETEIAKVIAKLDHYHNGIEKAAVAAKLKRNVGVMEALQQGGESVIEPKSHRQMWEDVMR